MENTQSFMGNTCYYHRFINGFYKLASPITSLQKNWVIYIPTKELSYLYVLKCQESFDWLKYSLIVDTIIKTFDPNEEYLVCTNACLERLGVLK